MRAYIACVAAVAAVALAGWEIFLGFSLDDTTLVVGLALCVLCAAERLKPVSFGMGNATFEFGGVPILCALVLGGPACALLVALPSAVYRNPSRTVFQGAVLVLQVLAASLAFWFLSPEPLLANPQLSTTFVFGTLAAGLAYFAPLS